MNEFYVALAVVGGLLLLLGLTSGLIKSRLLASEPLVALFVGVMIGPVGLGLLDISRWGDQAALLEEATRLTLAIALMGVALRLPKGYTRRHWRSLALLLGVVMPLMWLSSGLLVYLVLGLPLWLALLIGAVVTPTDPVVASSIVTGKYAENNLPERLRNLLSAESGANDGLALPFVMLPILFLTRSPGEALGRWFSYTLLWEVVVAVLLGFAVGYLAGELLRWSQKQLHAEQVSVLSISLALSLVTLGLVKLLGSDGILATFVAGLAFDWFAEDETTESHERIQDVVTRFFDLPVFVLFGLALPWQAWLNLGWVGLLLTALVLLLRRLPAILVLYRFITPLRSWPDALFVGWFGPVGIAALFYASLARRETGNELVWTVASLVVFASLLLHGISATPLTRLYSRVSGSETQNEALSPRAKSR